MGTIKWYAQGAAVGWLFSSLFLTSFARSDGMIVLVLLIVSMIAGYLDSRK